MRNRMLARRRRSPEVSAAKATTSSAPPSPAPSTGCWAPDATLYFAPDGTVRACCVNTEYPLGRIGEQSIHEIWEGARTQALRDALARDDYSLGCQECGARTEAGNRAWSNAPQFDEYAGDGVPTMPRRLDFVLSNTCNLQCEMCHGDLSSAIRAKREHRPPMPKAYGDDFFEELRDFLPHLELAVFLGGEPFLARESRRVLDLMLELDLQIPTRIVTNGTMWNDAVERYLRDLPIDLAVSVDGATPETLESLRVGVDFAELHTNVDRYEATMAARGGTVSFHYCLMVQNWHELGAFLLEADRRDRHVIVMTVTEPVRFSLFDLAADELLAVITALEAEDRTIGSQLGRNAEVWQAELDRLRRHHAALVEGNPVAWVHATSAAPEPEAGVPVVLLPTRGKEADPELTRLAAELEGWAGRPPIVVSTRSGMVAGVDAPEWADHLEPETWTGTAVERLAYLLGRTLGTPSSPALDRRPDGVLQVAIEFTAEGATVHMQALVSPQKDGDVMLFLSDLAPLATSG